MKSLIVETRVENSKEGPIVHAKLVFEGPIEMTDYGDHILDCGGIQFVVTTEPGEEGMNFAPEGDADVHLDVFKATAKTEIYTE